MRGTTLLALPALLYATATHGETRNFCADRPGLGTPACTLAPGEVMAELGLGAWQRDSDADTTTLGDLLLRVGVDEHTEIEAGLPIHEVARERTGARSAGAGDFTLAVRRGLGAPDGPVAVHAFVTLPTGARGIGAGTWGAGALLPAAFVLPHGFEVDVTPEAEAAPNASGSGRHVAFGAVVGIGRAIGKALSAQAEVAVFRDLDPSGHSTPATAAFSLAWQATRDFQLDLEADAGLTAAAPRRAFAVGLARRFP